MSITPHNCAHTSQINPEDDRRLIYDRCGFHFVGYTCGIYFSIHFIINRINENIRKITLKPLLRTQQSLFTSPGNDETDIIVLNASPCKLSISAGDLNLKPFELDPLTSSGKKRLTGVHGDGKLVSASGCNSQTAASASANLVGGGGTLYLFYMQDGILQSATVSLID